MPPRFTASASTVGLRGSTEMGAKTRLAVMSQPFQSPIRIGQWGGQIEDMEVGRLQHVPIKELFTCLAPTRISRKSVSVAAC